MSEAFDGAAVDKRGILGEVLDFHQSALHSVIESPINGIIQCIDHAADIHLPELNIIGAPTHNTLGAKAGAIVGPAVDLIAISIATGGAADLLGCAGLVGGVATAAATGAIYGGLLTPTDNKSEHFFKDRFENGAVSAVTFAAMGGAAKALDAAGLFAVPAARSLFGSLTYGGLAGAAGGAAGAEATAVIKEGKPLPSGGELASSVGTQALFGAAYGGLGYAYNHINGPASRPTETHAGGYKITTINDADGQPVAFHAELPKGKEDPLVDLVYKGTKMTDGTWKSDAYWIRENGGAGRTLIPQFNGVTRSADGTVVITDKEGNVRTFAPGHYTTANPEWEAGAAAREYAKKNYDHTYDNGERQIESETQGFKRFDQYGRATVFADRMAGNNQAFMEYDLAGDMERVELRSGKSEIRLRSDGENTWKFHKGGDSYIWNGKIEQVKDAAGLVDALTLTPENGKPLTFNTTSGVDHIWAMLNESGHPEKTR